MSTASDDDGPLVGLARQHDFAAFERLVGKYERRVYGLALRIVGRREDAEEVTQQTFVSVIEHLDGFAARSLFSTWLMRIATNHALVLLRKRKRQRTVSLAEDRDDEDFDGLPHPEFVAQWRQTPDEIATQRETQELLTRALDELHEKYRLVFILRDVEGLSTEETAETMGISVANVKVRLLRARLMLRERLTRFFGDERTQIVPH